MITILFLIFQLLFAVFFLYLCIAFVTGAPFVPSTKSASTSMIRLANIQKGNVVYDLGSGDGRLLFLAAKMGATAIGVEINPFLVIFTNLKSLFSPYRKQVKAKWQDFWKSDLTNADRVFVYLLPWKMQKLEKKLREELKPEAQIISNSFIFKSWKLEAKDEAKHIYVFKR